MIKSRLLLLADRLDKIAATPVRKRTRIFDLSGWVRIQTCGTAACAVGEATFLKRFRLLGLKYSRRIHDIVYRGSYGWDAVQRFFGISNHEATRLFLSTHYPTDGRGRVKPQQVADRIRSLVETSSLSTASAIAEPVSEAA